MSQVVRVVSLNGKPRKPHSKKLLGFLNRQASKLPTHTVREDAYGDGVVELADGTLKKYIECQGLNVLLWDEKQRESLARSFAHLANSLDTDIQVLVTSRSEPIEQELKRYPTHPGCDEYIEWYAKYTRKWFDRTQELYFVPHRRFYIVISHAPSRSGPPVTAGELPAHDEKLRNLSRLTATAVECLRYSGLSPRKLSQDQVAELLVRHTENLAGRDTVCSNVALGPPKTTCAEPVVSDAGLMLGSQRVGTLFVSELPHELWFGWLIDLLIISCNYTISFHIHDCLQAEVRQKVAKNYGGKQDSEAARNVSDFLRSSNKAFDIGIYISTWAETDEDLQGNLQEITRLFATKGAKLEPARDFELEGWCSTLPIGVDRLRVHHRVTSQVLGTCWPFFDVAAGSAEGVPVGFIAATREPVLFDPFATLSKRNTNIIALGEHDSGKSFTAQAMVLKLLTQAARCIVMDTAGDYKFLAEVLGPEQCARVDFRTGSCTFNPFAIPSSSGTDQSWYKERSRLISFIETFLHDSDCPKLSLENRAYLHTLLCKTFSAMDPGTFPTMETFSIALSDSITREPKATRLSNEFKPLRSLVAMMQFSEVATLFNADLAPLSRPLVLFDISGILDPLLKLVAARAFTDLIIRHIERAEIEKVENDQKTLIVMDDTSVLFGSLESCNSLNELSTCARHNNDTILFSVTSETSRLLGNTALQTLQRHAGRKLLFKHSKGDLPIIRTSLALSEAALAAIESFQEGDASERLCLLDDDNHASVIRIVASTLDFWLCTKDPESVRRRMESVGERAATTNNRVDACRSATYSLIYN